MRIFGLQPALPVLAAVLLCVAGVGTGRGQVLARKNWAGSGVTVEPWWRRAVFYRINPARFQDSDGDGVGDLAGIVQRLDYLQGLGVDALILDPAASSDPGATAAVAGFDDLARQATGRHLRVIVALGAPASQAPSADAQYLAVARSWLNQGAAGLYVPVPALQKVDGSTHIGVLLHQLRVLTDSFPGGRLLMAGAPAPVDMDVWRSLVKEAQLTAGPAISGGSGAPAGVAASLRTQLEAGLAGPPPGVVAERTRRGAPGPVDPLLRAARVGPGTDAAEAAALRRTLAAALLASRAAVILEFGQELGLQAEGGQAPMMQWTPENVTRKPPPPPEPKEEAPAPPKPEFEPFRPYVAPPKNIMPQPKTPVVIMSDDPQPVVIDPNSLPGFTDGEMDSSLAANNGATANVAMEQADPKSLLNLYMALIQLHHDNAAVRNGAQMFIDHDAEGALVWVRRAPAGSKTMASVVVVCRLGAGLVGEAEVKVVRNLVGVSGDVVSVGEGR
jgi:hypothetical protein